MDIYSLPALTVLSDYITLCQLDNCKVIRIQHPKAKAAISLFGAHLLSYQPNNEKDLLWVSEKADFSCQKPIRGGVPICWPWFGKAADPAHGFARNQEWSIKTHRENDNGVILSLALEANTTTMAIWPHQFALELQLEVNDSLKISLITTNTGTEPFDMGGALHSYFAVGDITKTEVLGLGDTYLEFQQQKSSEGVANFSTEVDRIYTNAESISSIQDTANQRIIEISHGGNDSVVVWNPWQELATAMADMDNEGYKSMVCVESTCYANNLSIAPQETHSLSAEISLSK